MAHSQLIIVVHDKAIIDGANYWSYQPKTPIDARNFEHNRGFEMLSRSDAYCLFTVYDLPLRRYNV